MAATWLAVFKTLAFPSSSQACAAGPEIALLRGSAVIDIAQSSADSLQIHRRRREPLGRASSHVGPDP